MTEEIIAQIFGALALIAYIISTQIDDRHRVLRWRTVYSTVYALQYFFLGAYSGVLSSITPIARNIAYDKTKKRPPIFWITLFSLLTLVPGLIFCESPIDLLPLIHTVICTIFLGIDNLTIFRVSQFFAAPLVLIYNFSVSAYIGMLIVIIQFISNTVSIIRFDLPRFKKYLNKKHSVKNRKNSPNKRK